jgi:hypothetical protein
MALVVIHTYTCIYSYIYLPLECYVEYVRNAMMLMTSVAVFVCRNIIFRPFLLQAFPVVFAMPCFKYRPGQPLCKVRLLLDFLTCPCNMPSCTTNFGACPFCPFQSIIQRSRCIPSCLQRHYAVNSIPQLERRGISAVPVH